MSAIDVFWAAPPVSRTLAAATFAFSVAVHTNMLSIYHVVFFSSALMKLPPQVWRIFTAFLITGKDLGILFDTYFLYTYGSKLETASPRFSNKEDFFTYLLFICATILGLNIFITGGYILTPALVLALAYTACQDDRGQKSHFLVFAVPALWIPYAMLLMTLVMAGPDQAKIQATGLVAAHLHDFLTRLWPTFGGGRNLVPTPGFIKRLFHMDGRSRRPYGTASTTSPATSTSASASGSSGVLPESWRSRGSGHRLGGD